MKERGGSTQSLVENNWIITKYARGSAQVVKRQGRFVKGFTGFKFNLHIKKI